MVLWELPVRAVLSTPMQREAKRPVLELRLPWECLVSPRAARAARTAVPGPALQARSRESWAAAPGLSAAAPGSWVAAQAQGVRLLRSRLRGPVRSAEPRPYGNLAGPVTLQSRTQKLLIEPLESI